MMQLELWRRGTPVLDDIDIECCPVFACCQGMLYLASDHLRELFVRDPTSRDAMMRDFIAALPDPVKAMEYDLPGVVAMRLEPKR